MCSSDLSFFLLILGILFLKNSEEKLLIDDEQNKLNSFAQGFAISILNPKILIWFAAIFSQFIDVASTSMTKFVMVFIASSIDGVWYVIVTITVTAFGLKHFIESNTKTIQNISGITLIFISLINFQTLTFVLLIYILAVDFYPVNLRETLCFVRLILIH